MLSIDADPALQVVGALSLSRDIAWGLGAMLEGYTFERGEPYVEHDAGLLMGLSYSLAPEVMFDIGGDVALYNSRSATLFVGVTFLPFIAR